MKFEKLFKAIDLQNTWALNPGYRRNETIGDFIVSESDFEELEYLMATFEMRGHYHYRDFDLVTARLQLCHDTVWDSKNRFDVHSATFTKGGYRFSEDSVRVRYWISNIDSTNICTCGAMLSHNLPRKE